MLNGQRKDLPVGIWRWIDALSILRASTTIDGGGHEESIIALPFDSCEEKSLQPLVIKYYVQ
jgi:hypothetical protein